jgi:hypothetical protein
LLFSAVLRARSGLKLSSSGTLLPCLLHDFVREYCLGSYVKVAGAKGLHVYVPLNTPVTYDVTSAFSEFVAGTLAWYPWVFSFRLRRMCCNRMIVTVIPIGEMHQADFDRRCRAKTSVAHQISYVGESCGNVSWLHGKHVLTG